MDLAAYRHDAEVFYTVREREYYRHYAGLQPGYDVEPIYGRFAHLFSREAVLALRACFAAADAADGHERRRLRMLLAFAADGHVGAATAALESQIAAVQSSTRLELDGVEVGYRDSLAIQANEPDADRRAAIEEARLAVLEGGLAARQREFVARQHEAAQSLGWQSYAEMCAECQGVNLAALH